MSRREINDEELAQSRRRVSALLRITLLAWLASLVLSGIGYFAGEIGYDSEPVFAFVATATFAIPALWLMVSTIRLSAQTSEFVGLRTASAIVAGAVLIAGCAISLPPLVSEVRNSVLTAIQKSQPPTAAELEYTPLELEAVAVEAFEEAFAVVTDVVPAGEDLLFYDGSCRTSNLENGWTYGGEAWVDIAALDPEFRSTTADGWEDLGYSTHPAPADSAWPDPLVAVQGEYVEQLALIEVSDRVLMTFEAICVPGTNPLPDEGYRRGPESSYWAERGPFTGG
jgi:hypothetical protein